MGKKKQEQNLVQRDPANIQGILTAIEQGLDLLNGCSIKGENSEKFSEAKKLFIAAGNEANRINKLLEEALHKLQITNA